MPFGQYFNSLLIYLHKIEELKSQLLFFTLFSLIKKNPIEQFPGKLKKKKNNLTSQILRFNTHKKALFCYLGMLTFTCISTVPVHH